MANLASALRRPQVRTACGSIDQQPPAFPRFAELDEIG
jgi:hypothetical protein